MDGLFNEPGGAQADFGFGAKKKESSQARKDENADIVVKTEVPGRTARLGGTVTVRYERTRRSSDGVNVYNYAEIYDLRVPPRSCTSDVLRCERMGNFSTTMNRYGDLVCVLTVLEETGTHHPRRDSHVESAQESKKSAPSASDESGSVHISLVEAVLGGRVRVETPKGGVHVTIPPGTSSGKVLRLKGKAKGGGDWMVRIEIDVPRDLDAESRDLIERFGELNPMDLKT